MSEQLHHVVMRSHSAKSFVAFLTDEFGRTHDAAKSFASDVTIFDTGTPGVDLFVCTVGGVPVEFMGAYAPEANSETSDATKD